MNPSVAARLTVYAADQTPPVVMMPVAAGKARANNAVVMPAADGTLAALLDQGSADVVLDLVGFFE